METKREKHRARQANWFTNLVFWDSYLQLHYIDIIRKDNSRQVMGIVR